MFSEMRYLDQWSPSNFGGHGVTALPFTTSLPMIEIEQVPEGVVIQVKALPGSRKNEVRGEQDGMLRVSVTQIPEKGKANKAVQEQLAKGLGLRKSQVQLISGETSPLKRFLITGVSVEDLSERIRLLMQR
jgi:uncharacterized protein YggU (UPF0235/DUF167 family)